MGYLPSISDVLQFIGRFVIDALIFYWMQGQYSAWEYYQAPILRPDETQRQYGPRRSVLGHMERTIWYTEHKFGDGEECKQWFRERMEEIPVQELRHWDDLMQADPVRFSVSEQKLRERRVREREVREREVRGAEELREAWEAAEAEWMEKTE